MLSILRQIYEQIFKFTSTHFSFLILVLVVILFVLLFERILIHFINLDRFSNAKALKKIAVYIVRGIGVFIVVMNIPSLRVAATTLLASSGVVAVIIGIASQNAFSNIINGMMIIFYKPFEIGDLITVYSNNGNIVGTVQDISLRHTVLASFENTKYVITNTQMNSWVIENISRNQSQKGALLKVGIAYDADVEKAIEIIQKVVSSHPKFVDARKNPNDPLVRVRLASFEDSSLLLTSMVHSYSAPEVMNMLSDIRIQILKEFDANNIEIPYNYLNVITKKDE